jgi:HEXXH motif-containing protein
MKIEAHAFPRALFDSMAAGRGGLAAMRALAAGQHSKHLLLVRGVVMEAGAAGADQARLARQGYEVLTAVQRVDRHAADIMLRYPAVGAWAARTLHGLRDGSPMAGAEPARLCAVAASAAARAKIEAEVELGPTQGTLVLPSLGAAVISTSAATAYISGDTAEIRSPDGRIEIPREPGRQVGGWLPLRRIREGTFDVIVDDLDPFRMPAVSGLASRLSARRMTSWEASVQEGWRLITRSSPICGRGIPRCGHRNRASQESVAWRGQLELTRILRCDRVVPAPRSIHVRGHVRA